MRENEPVLLVLSVCDGKIILEKGEILYEKCHLMSNIHLFPPRSADGSLVGKSGEWYEPYCKNWLFEDVHPCGRLRKRTVLLYMLSGTKRSFLETIELVMEAEAHHPAQSPKGVMCQDAPLCYPL